MSEQLLVRLKTFKRTALGKCTHQCDETQENNSIQALSTEIVCFGRKKIDRDPKEKKKKKAKNRTDVKQILKILLRMNQHSLILNMFIHQLLVCRSSVTVPCTVCSALRYILPVTKTK